MTYVYIDESGDLGFDHGGTRFFIITALLAKDEKTNAQLLRISKKVRERSLTKQVMKTSELKFSNSSPLIRERFLSRMDKLDVDVFSLIIEKRFTDKRLQEKLPVLYNYLIKILLEKIFHNISLREKVIVCLDRSMSASQRMNFETYVSTALLDIFRVLPEVEIRHEDSSRNGGLQVVDFACGAFGYKYNTMHLSGDAMRYIDIFSTKIRFCRDDFFKGKK
jgi:hypothetical protein